MFLIIVNFYFQLLLAQTLSNLRGRHHPSMSSPETGSYSIIILLGSSSYFYLQSTQFSQTSGAKWKKLKELEPHEEARKKNGRSDYHITIISPMASNWSKHLGPHKNKVRQ